MSISNKKFTRVFLPLIITLLSGVNFTANAAEEEEEKDKKTKNEQSVMDVIVVTAKKREQSIQEVPMAISAFTGDNLEKLGIQEGLNITQHVPNMNFFAIFGEASSPSISLRGVSLVNYSDSWEAPVSLYVDDVYRGNPSGSSIQMFDIGRVEVLRGPQGTLFGRNNTGGLVHHITNNPTDEFEAKASLQIGSYNQKIFEGVVNSPLSDKVRARFAIKSHKADGWQTNHAEPVNDYGLDVGLDDLNGTDTLGYRLKLAIDIGEDSELLLDAHGSKADQTSVGFAHMGYRDPANTDNICAIDRIHRGECTSFFGTTGIIEAGGNFSPEHVSSSIGGGTKTVIDTFGISAKLTIPMSDDVVLTSITALETMDKFLQDDGDGIGSAGTAWNVWFDEEYTADTEQFTQELRLNGNTDKATWVAGFYYYDDSRDLTTKNPAGTDYAVASTYAWFSHREAVLLETESWAVFGQVDYELSDDMTLVAGLRYTTDDRTYHYERPLSYYNSPNEDDGLVVDDDMSEDGFSGRLGINFTPDDDTLLYASISTGLRAGGYSASYNSKPAAFDPVGQEKNTSLEAGIKTTFADGNVRLNAAIFKYTIEGFQAQLFESLAEGNVIINAGDVDGMGAEADLTWAASKNLEIIAGLGILSTEMDSDKSTIVAGESVALDGNELPSAPKLSYNLIGRYYIGSVTLQLDYSWQDDHFLQVENDPYSLQGAYGLANASIAWTSEDGTWGVSAFAHNLANEEFFTYQNSLGTDWGYGVWGKPRTIGVRVNWNTF